MWIDVNKVRQICQKLELPLPMLSNKSSTFALDAFNSHIYNKFFMDNVGEPKNVEKDLEYHFRTVLNTDIRSNQTGDIAPSADDIWIFGYGSLVWKADFPFIDRRRGFICGYIRRFYQHSIDHRGTPNRPGRVVTLLATNNKEDRVYGIAYRIAAQQKRKVLRHLDYREKNGYQRCSVRFYEFPESAGARLMITMYIATRDNESFAGDVSDIFSIAKQIFTSSGPSGTNREYLFKLATAMRELFPGVSDDHLFELEQEVNRLIETEEDEALARGLKKEIALIISSSLNNSVDGAPSDDESNIDAIIKRLEVLKNWLEKPGSRETILTKALHSVHETKDYRDSM